MAYKPLQSLLQPLLRPLLRLPSVLPSDFLSAWGWIAVASCESIFQWRDPALWVLLQQVGRRAAFCAAFLCVIDLKVIDAALGERFGRELQYRAQAGWPLKQWK